MAVFQRTCFFSFWLKRTAREGLEHSGGSERFCDCCRSSVLLASNRFGGDDWEKCHCVGCVLMQLVASDRALWRYSGRRGGERKPVACPRVLRGLWCSIETCKSATHSPYHSYQHWQRRNDKEVVGEVCIDCQWQTAPAALAIILIITIVCFHTFACH